ncbi:MAG TPA: non-reducing end alpha-L-arabinofuranosidase family hydrolase [Candidatus Brocadiia bacterium]|nr:non-reducing end alpha-L-arabinofuranosidase family hydrolase [Candidatus Brocadiia bacterium]
MKHGSAAAGRSKSARAVGAEQRTLFRFSAIPVNSLTMFVLTALAIALSAARIAGGEEGMDKTALETTPGGGRSWIVGRTIMEPGLKGGFDETSVKDASIIFHGGKWHVFFTARGLGRASTGYACASTLEGLKTAPRRELLQTGIRENGYACAPQILYFSPHRKWYLIFQIFTGKRTHSPFYMTTETIADPDSWTEPKSLVVMDEDAKWIDFWMICDEEYAYLFYTRNHNDVCFRRARIADFPSGFGKPETVFSGIHEAVHIYKVKDAARYHMIYEVRTKSDVRSFGLAEAENLAGPWRDVAREYATGSQLAYPDGIEEWTDEVSHGEAIRTGYDEKMEYDPSETFLVVQGLKAGEHRGSYADLPWRTGVIKLNTRTRKVEPWTAKKAGEWYTKTGSIKGFNYLPRSAVNTTEMWQADTFDPKTIDQELSWAQDAGYNSLRVFLQYIVWRDDPDGMLARFEKFLSIADSRGMKVMPVLFCDCSFAGKEPYTGRQDAPIPGVHNSGWTPSPGLKRVVDRSAWPDLKSYVMDVVGKFANDERILVWDLYNEPGNSGMGEKSLPLCEAIFRWARSANPSQPLTIAPWADFNSDMSRRLMEWSDVITFHGYDPPAGIRTKIEICGRYGRPVICTEWLHRQSGNTFESILPIFAENRIGWYHWGLVAGRTQTFMPWGSKPGDPIPETWQHDVFHPDGKPYRESEIEMVGKWSAPR